ncbi:hypothetical protein RB195_010989 [Necator americanus]|uniref:Uncharacterized protein n=1 Tax=Necator americanus TaxID=51031 RepID=A0ABR1D264_NECAM
MSAYEQLGPAAGGANVPPPPDQQIPPELFTAPGEIDAPPPPVEPPPPPDEPPPPPGGPFSPSSPAKNGASPQPDAMKDKNKKKQDQGPTQKRGSKRHIQWCLLASSIFIVLLYTGGLIFFRFLDEY